MQASKMEDEASESAKLRQSFNRLDLLQSRMDGLSLRRPIVTSPSLVSEREKAVGIGLGMPAPVHAASDDWADEPRGAASGTNTDASQCKQCDTVRLTLRAECEGRIRREREKCESALLLLCDARIRIEREECEAKCEERCKLTREALERQQGDAMEQAIRGLESMREEHVHELRSLRRSRRNYELGRQGIFRELELMSLFNRWFRYRQASAIRKRAMQACQ